MVSSAGSLLLSDVKRKTMSSLRDVLALSLAKKESVTQGSGKKDAHMHLFAGADRL